MSFTLDNPAVQTYIACAAVSTAKMLSMSGLTGVMGIIRGAFASQENVKSFGGEVTFHDPVIERIRRAHRNDLEIIPPFWITGALYLTTNPSVAWAKFLFRAFTVARIIHTFVYAIVPMPQPIRFIVFGPTWTTSFIMAIQVILHYIKAL